MPKSYMKFILRVILILLGLLLAALFVSAVLFTPATPEISGLFI